MGILQRSLYINVVPSLSWRIEFHTRYVACSRFNSSAWRWLNNLQHVTTMNERCKAWVCGHSLAGIAGSNPTRWGMDVCLSWSLRRADPSIRGALPCVSLSVIRCNNNLHTYYEEEDRRQAKKSRLCLRVYKYYLLRQATKRDAKRQNGTWIS
jgi:hypothetical protein